MTPTNKPAKPKGKAHPSLPDSAVDPAQVAGLQASLKESEERYRDLFENANDLIQSVDPKGHFLYVNRAWKETMGYTDKEVARLSVFDIIAPSCQDHCLTIFQRVMRGEKVQRVEVQFVAK